jgi:tellurite resistance protein TerC
MREATLWVVFYVTLALIFAGLMFAIGDAQHGVEFLAGWLTEYSLSIDNLFVFVLIMGRFAVPKKYQQEALMIGIIMALIFRAVFILLGAQLIENFSWIFYIFGAWLVYTAYKQITHNEDETPKDNAFVRLLKRKVNFTDGFREGKLRVKENGVWHFTPMLLVLFALGTTDILFALDSIPAIFGITESPFIVFTANLFALMGLRQLYFLLGGLLDRLIYLKFGIAFILAFIGVKLVLHAMHVNELPFINGGEPIKWAPEISTWVSLLVILAAMTVATLASVVHAKREAALTGVRMGLGAREDVSQDAELRLKNPENADEK